MQVGRDASSKADPRHWATKRMKTDVDSRSVALMICNRFEDVDVQSFGKGAGMVTFDWEVHSSLSFTYADDMSKDFRGGVQWLRGTGVGGIDANCGR